MAAPHLKTVYLSLGSNRGDRVAHIRQALDLLEESGLEVFRVSSFYKTEPVDFRPQPWFVNCVAEVGTELMPMRLLHRLQQIERTLGRHHRADKGPRPIDIDILFYESAVVHSPRLTIPHAHLEERRFVLIPLRELDANLRHPVTHRTILDMLHETKDLSQVLRLREQE